ncbi:tRNA pseudouridine synthase [Rhypophila sp. PSN 637]
MAGDEQHPEPSNMAASDPVAAAPADSTPSNEQTPDGTNSASNGDAGGKRDRGSDGGGRGGKRGRKGNDKQASGKKNEFLDRRQEMHDKREAKRRKVIDGESEGSSFMRIPFTSDEIAAEGRRPKRKVAMLIGYAGTGYHGLQINHKEKTIEGDIFAALVAAGGIAKANADDPKKSSLIRCARTDKGVHAAGNVLSLKMIVEEPDIVQKINANLPDQIRVWGIQRTLGSFSAYQECDSRWYEYLMPSYALLPPHPESYLGKKITEYAKAKGVEEEYLERRDETRDFWDVVEENEIKPIFDRMAPEVRAEVLRRLKEEEEQLLNEEDIEKKAQKPAADVEMQDAPTEEPATEPAVEPVAQPAPSDELALMGDGAQAPDEAQKKKPRQLSPVELGIREVKAAYVAAKRRYRATPARLERLQEALNLYLGTHNFHNYTILKRFSDPSAKRHIKSFKLNRTPIMINDTEWISLKIHGQSFMMHQIRKMVAMAVMIVRSGTPNEIISQSYESRRISIPKAPGLGLLLERPVFEMYNKKAAGADRELIDFDKYDEEIQKFKDDHIYKRMFDLEEKENSFHLFFNQVDNTRTDYFLWVTAGGFEASPERSDRIKIPKALENELGDEPDGVQEVGS